MKGNPAARRREAAFTLIEALVSLVLILILTGIAIWIYRKSADFRRGAEARIVRSVELRGIFDALARDLAGAFPLADAEPFAPLPSFEINPGAPADDGDVVTFATATGNTGPVEFAHVRYRASGGRLYRESWPAGEDGWSGEEESVLASGVRRVLFEREPPDPPGGVLTGVRVELRMGPAGALPGEESDNETVIYKRLLAVPAGWDPGGAP